MWWNQAVCFALELQGHHRLSLCWHHGRLLSSPILKSLSSLCAPSPGLKTNVCKKGNKSEAWCHSAPVYTIMVPNKLLSCLTLSNTLRLVAGSFVARHCQAHLGKICSSASNSGTRLHGDIGFQLPILAAGWTGHYSRKGLVNLFACQVLDLILCRMMWFDFQPTRIWKKNLGSFLK